MGIILEMVDLAKVGITAEMVDIAMVVVKLMASGGDSGNACKLPRE